MDLTFGSFQLPAPLGPFLEPGLPTWGHPGISEQARGVNTIVAVTGREGNLSPPAFFLGIWLGCRGSSPAPLTRQAWLWFWSWAQCLQSPLLHRTWQPAATLFLDWSLTSFWLQPCSPLCIFAPLLVHRNIHLVFGSGSVFCVLVLPFLYYCCVWSPSGTLHQPSLSLLHFLLAEPCLSPLRALPFLDPAFLEPCSPSCPNLSSPNPSPWQLWLPLPGAPTPAVTAQYLLHPHGCPASHFHSHPLPSGPSVFSPVHLVSMTPAHSPTAWPPTHPLGTKIAHSKWAGQNIFKTYPIPQNLREFTAQEWPLQETWINTL